MIISFAPEIATRVALQYNRLHTQMEPNFKVPWGYTSAIDGTLSGVEELETNLTDSSENTRRVPSL